MWFLPSHIKRYPAVWLKEIAPLISTEPKLASEGKIVLKSEYGQSFKSTAPMSSQGHPRGGVGGGVGPPGPRSERMVFPHGVDPRGSITRKPLPVSDQIGNKFAKVSLRTPHSCSMTFHASDPCKRRQQDPLLSQRITNMREPPCASKTFSFSCSLSSPQVKNRMEERKLTSLSETRCSRTRCCFLLHRNMKGMICQGCYSLHILDEQKAVTCLRSTSLRAVLAEIDRKRD